MLYCTEIRLVVYCLMILLFSVNKLNITLSSYTVCVIFYMLYTFYYNSYSIREIFEFIFKKLPREIVDEGKKSHGYNIMSAGKCPDIILYTPIYSGSMKY